MDLAGRADRRQGGELPVRDESASVVGQGAQAHASIMDAASAGVRRGVATDTLEDGSSRAGRPLEAHT
jgi:hypothetical protein